MVEARLAAVRPRIRKDGSELAHLLEDEVAELLRADGPQDVRLCGRRGSGKTTALQHLAARFPGERRLVLVDEKGQGSATPDAIVVRATREPKPLEAISRTLWFHLEPWSDDEILEYVLARHREHVNALVEKLRLDKWPTALRSDLKTATAVLDRLATDERAVDLHSALLRFVDEGLDAKRREPLERTALLLCCSDFERGVAEGVVVLDRPPAHSSVLAKPSIRGALAARALMEAVHANRFENELPLPRWPPELVAALRERLRSDAEEQARLRAAIARGEQRHYVVLSLLCIACEGESVRGRLRDKVEHAYLVGSEITDLSHCQRIARSNLRRARIVEPVVTSLQLEDVALESAQIAESLHLGVTWRRVDARKLQASRWRAERSEFKYCIFDEADFREARFVTCLFLECRLRRTNARHAGWITPKLDACDLREAHFDEARFECVTFVSCELRGASFRGASLRNSLWTRLNLSSVDLEGADLVFAGFFHVDLSGTTVPGFYAPDAEFSSCDLGDSRWPRALLPRARFDKCRLHGIAWPGADLYEADFRRSTFHLGNSRSGLVGSPIASEGSRTGFYTDEHRERTFRSPEEVRVADLTNADLRGAQLEGTDFYLVDVRGARLDAAQRRYLRSCKAILD